MIIINFWATWCAPCKKELPELDAYYKQFQNRGLRVFAVTTEDSVPLRRLSELFKVMTIPAVRKVKGPYRTMGAVPTNIIIGRDGVVRYAKAAAFDRVRLHEIVGPLLREQPLTVTAGAP